MESRKLDDHQLITNALKKLQKVSGSMYYAYTHEIRLSSVAVCRAEGSKQDAPTLGKSLASL